MKRNMLTFAMLLVLFGSVFAGSTVSVGETIPVGGTTTTTTTTTTDPDPEPEPDPEPADSGGLGGPVFTNDEGDSIAIGEEGIVPLDGEEEAGEEAEEEGEEPTPGAEGGSEEDGSLGVGLPTGGSSESPTPEEESVCGTAFVLFAIAAVLFARRS